MEKQTEQEVAFSNLNAWDTFLENQRKEREIKRIKQNLKGATLTAILGYLIYSLLVSGGMNMVYVVISIVSALVIVRAIEVRVEKQVKQEQMQNFGFGAYGRMGGFYDSQNFK